MNSKKIVFKETGLIAVGELIGSAIMIGVFLALGHFQLNVLWSALGGSAIMIGNYFFMAVTVTLASERAASGEVEQAQKMVQMSSILRLLAMGGLLFLGIRLGANVIALVLPLTFARPVLMLSEFFRKKGD